MRVVLRPGEQVIVEMDRVRVHITPAGSSSTDPLATLATVITSVDGHNRNVFKARPEEDVAVPDGD